MDYCAWTIGNGKHGTEYNATEQNGIEWNRIE